MKTKAIKWLNAHITDDITKGEYDIIQYIKGVLRAEKEPITVSVDWRPMFETLWRAYPRKVAKAQALKTFEKKIKGKDEVGVKALCLELWAKIKKRKAIWVENETDVCYIPHFSTFINQETL